MISAIRRHLLARAAAITDNGDINIHSHGGHMNSALTTKTSKVLAAILIGLLILLGFAMLMAYLGSTDSLGGSLIIMDDDVTHSVLWWMIAIPIIILSVLLVLGIMAGAGLLVALIVAACVVVALLAVIFGLAMAILPIAFLLAIPVLIIWGIVKLANRKPRIEYVTLPPTA
jgi:hypothetical protein